MDAYDSKKIDSYILSQFFEIVNHFKDFVCMMRQFTFSAKRLDKIKFYDMIVRENKL